jgi:S-DNA-T family DNA segregation ATPase FtsK/SpoIIIE
LRVVAVIIGAIVLLYGTFSTLFHDTSLVGNIGRQLGTWNLRLFGYLAYVDFPMLFYPLFRFYRRPALMRRRDGYVGWILFFLSLVILQPLLVGVERSGVLGRELYLAMSPFIGLAGLWLFWLMIFALSLSLLIEDTSLLNRRWEALTGYWSEWKSRKKRDRKPGRTTKASKKQKGSEKSRKIPEISFGWIRELFRNPFDHEKEKEMERILSMELPPIEVEPDAPAKTAPLRLRSERKGNIRKTKEDPVEDLLKYRKAMEAQVEEEAGELEIREQIFATAETPEPEEESNGSIRSEEETVVPAKAKQELSPASPANASAKRSQKAPHKAAAAGGVPIVEELEENTELLARIEKGKVAKPKNFKLPKLDFLQKAPRVKRKINEAEIDRKIQDLLTKLQQFRIEGDVIRTYSGPLVTTFEFKPAPNVKVSKILGLQDDLAMALSAKTIRIQAPIPGRDVVGIEIPNETVETIYLREILESDIFRESKSPLTVALGKDIVGNPFVTDIRKLPHLLVAGTTGSGKSVGINAMILSLLYRNDPDQLKLMLIDPKMLEFSMYNDIPHLITPVIIEPSKAIAALANMVGEMERRYRLMAESRTKNIENYNEKVKKEGGEPFPYIVVVIDELADLMMNGGKEVELSIARLAQKSRACGIHLIVATQRPSVDVVTGLIKANLPSRLSYRVGQRIDSKVILDQMGAESLLGRGDALFTPPGATGLVRIHAPWSSEEEIDTIVEFLKAQRLPEYDESYLVAGGDIAGEEEGEGPGELDPLYEKAKEIVLTDKKTSISYLQRKLQIGYNRSANLIEQLEQTGVLSPPNAKGAREILV